MMLINHANICYLRYISAWLVSFPCPAPDKALLPALKTALPGFGPFSMVKKPRYLEQSKNCATWNSLLQKLRYLGFLLDLIRLSLSFSIVLAPMSLLSLFLLASKKTNYCLIGE